MIVVMKPDATKAHINRVVELVREMGLKEHLIQGTELTVVAVIGDDRKKDRRVFETLEGVQKVMPVLAPYKRSSIEVKTERTVVRIGDHCIVGGTEVPVIAGPCSVEGEQAIIEAARSVKAAGAVALRGGAFKPRTSPYAFQGHGEDGLKMLAAARAETGLAIVTEVLTPEDVELVARYADCLQVGTRNAQNYKLLEACGAQPRPILYKRGMAMTIDEYLLAAEYILDAGNDQVILCERGIRTFENHVRNTLALAAVPELHHRSHLPVAVDPSHGTGHTHLVPAMCHAAVAAGGDALVVEVHPDPPHAWTDGAQSITPQVLDQTLEITRRVAEAMGRRLPRLSPVGV
jgi:3-deoxy-7-phosphoheptulonate synthase